VSLDAAAFRLIERRRRFRGQTLEIAKRRILNGERASDLAAAYGVNLQRIYMIETQVTAAWRELQPKGWEEVTLVGPKHLIKEFQRRVKMARERLSRETRPVIPSCPEAESTQFTQLRGDNG
jgi:hypothetical protein